MQIEEPVRSVGVNNGFFEWYNSRNISRYILFIPWTIFSGVDWVNERKPEQYTSNHGGF